MVSFSAFDGSPDAVDGVATDARAFALLAGATTVMALLELSFPANRASASESNRSMSASVRAAMIALYQLRSRKFFGVGKS